MERQRDWRRVPASTYRLQLNRAFTFDDAAGVVPYLAALGVGWAYCSPIVMARPGSLHGYDIVDHGRINPELGGEDAFGRFTARLRAHGLGCLVDTVPNHMAADPVANPWWRDVLENGPCSRHAEAFDIDWAPVKSELRDRLLLPVLGDQYGHALERGELRVAYAAGGFVVRCADREFPVNPRQSTLVLRPGLDALRRDLGDADPHLRELLSIVTGLDHLPPYTSTSRDLIEERDREKEVLRDRLARLTGASPAVRGHIDRALGAINGDGTGGPARFDRLHELLEAQPYRLAYWRVAGDEINYRRFFDVNELAAIRQERPGVFEATHALVARLVDTGAVQGLRVDHPDGLFDPEVYFSRLRAVAAEPVPYVVAEKILSAGEPTPPWAIDGTTGYSFLNDAGGVFVRQEGAGRLRRVYGRVSGRRERPADVVFEAKLLILESALASELTVLVDALDRLSEADRRSRDFTRNSLRALLAATTAAFPIYRTYVSPRGCGVQDRAAIDHALAEARRRTPAMEASIFAFLRGVLLPPALPGSGAEAGAAGPLPFAESLDFSMRFQQLSAPVQAKGLEDTAFYRDNTLISLNEVGADPRRFGRTLAEFHAANAERLAGRPFEMTATSTHDTKLGEDARMRLAVLAEIPDAWSDAVRRWQRLTAGARRRVDDAWAPDGNDVYRFYQALAGTWPADRPAGSGAPAGLAARLQRYMTKALREAKLHTSWVNENRPYEAAMEAFVAHALEGPGAPRFLPAFEPFARRVAALGAVYSLGQLLLKIAAPGVPDFYQGTEAWTLTLVDPDNRGPVDFGARAAALADLEPLVAGVEDPASRAAADRAAGARALAAAWPDGRVKLYVTAAGLRLRRAHADLFLTGDYVPLDVEAGAAAPAGAVAFARTLGDRALVAIAPRFVAGLGADVSPSGGWHWGDARVVLPDGLRGRAFVDVFTGAPAADNGGALSLATLLAGFPVALLWAAPGRRP